jgi:glutamate-5-semialdehyde dehydrogenase
MSLTNASPLEAAKAARLASRTLAILPTAARNDALTAIHDALAKAKDEILAANAQDLAAAVKAAESGELSQSLIKRLDLSRTGKFEDMLEGILDVRKLEDPSMSAVAFRIRLCALKQTSNFHPQLARWTAERCWTMG